MVRWADLTTFEKSTFGNGCGLSWMPKWLINLFFGWFFEASCRRHDFGYARGGNESDRMVVDVGFLLGMWRDLALARLALKPALFVLSIVFFLLVWCFGWWRFSYGHYLSKEELMALSK